MKELLEKEKNEGEELKALMDTNSIPPPRKNWLCEPEFLRLSFPMSLTLKTLRPSPGRKPVILGKKSV